MSEQRKELWNKSNAQKLLLRITQNPDVIQATKSRAEKLRADYIGRKIDLKKAIGELNKIIKAIK